MHNLQLIVERSRRVDRDAGEDPDEDGATQDQDRDQDQDQDQDAKEASLDTPGTVATLALLARETAAVVCGGGGGGGEDGDENEHENEDDGYANNEDGGSGLLAEVRAVNAKLARAAAALGIGGV